MPGTVTYRVTPCSDFRNRVVVDYLTDDSGKADGWMVEPIDGVLLNFAQYPRGDIGDPLKIYLRDVYDVDMLFGKLATGLLDNAPSRGPLFANLGDDGQRMIALSGLHRFDIVADAGAIAGQFEFEYEIGYESRRNPNLASR